MTDLPPDIDTTGWSTEDIALYRDTFAQLDNMRKALATSESIDRAARESPAGVIARIKAETDEARASLARTDLARADAAALAEAEAKHGKDRVAVIETRSGNIIIRTETPREADEHGARASADGLSPQDREKIARGFLESLVVYPDKAGLKRLVDLYPGIWPSIAKVSNDLASGAVETRAKK